MGDLELARNARRFNEGVRRNGVLEMTVMMYDRSSTESGRHESAVFDDNVDAAAAAAAVADDLSVAISGWTSVTAKVEEACLRAPGKLLEWIFRC